jgi:potassium efflux system protein
MSLLKSTAVLVVSVIAASTTALAQIDATDPVSVAEIRSLRAKTESAELSDALRAKVAELLDAAAAAVEIAEGNRAAAQRYERERSGVARMVSDLKSELERRNPPPALDLGENPTVAQAEDALARERARLAASVAELQEQQRLADERTKSRADISKRLGELDHEIESLNRDLRTQADSTDRFELKTAARILTLARLDAAKSEIEMLRSHLALLVDRSALIPLTTDLAQRRVAAGEALVELHTRAAHQIRLESARSMLTHIHELGDNVSEELPQLAPVADETEELAETLLGENGIIPAAEKTMQDLAATRNHQIELNRIVDLTVRRFDAYGHRGSIQRWWPDIPDDFPKISAISETLRRLDEEIPEVEHQLIDIEQLRGSSREFRRHLLRDLAEELGDGFTSELENDVQELLSIRQDILDRLIRRGGQYSNQLVEYRALLANFLSKVETVERFLYSHLLWSRSVPRPIIPGFHDMAIALAWLVSPDHLQSIEPNRSDLRGHLLFTLILLVVTVALRRPLQGQLESLARQTTDIENDNLGLTLRALLVSLFLAIPLPLAIYILGMIIQNFAASAYWIASSRALIEIAFVAALLESIRQIFSPHGLAEVHFGWPTHATRPLHRGLLIIEAIGLPILYAAVHLAFAGMRLNSSDELQLHNNSLGRMAFVVALLFFGFAILSMLRPAKKSHPADGDMRVTWPRRFAQYAFPTAFLGAYPIIVLTTLVPATLAAFGYYITALLLAYQMLRTLLLASVVLVVGGVVHRSRSIRARRMLAASELHDADPSRLREFKTAERQSRHLFRFFAVAALVVGLVAIWSDALPMLEYFKRIQLLPTFAVLDEPETDGAALVSDDERPPQTLHGSGSNDGAQGSAPPSIPGAPAAEPAGSPATGHPLTLWLLIEAMLAALITVSLARNLPGVIEITLNRRTTLDSGARFAVSTLVKYTTAIVGSVTVFNLLGVGWSKVQWLAAALTFGLGFGLQEIVANFVSGLILLVERPVRVGDVVTIGTLMGKVSRIQIRATTITLWDRSEMVVPNKEFITTKLVNWTLSDSKRRIEIPLRVAYGADLEQVKSLLVAAAEAHPLVLDDPAPQALLLTFGDDAINFELRFVVDFGNGIRAKDDVQMAIDHAFKDHGISFAVPKLELQLPKGVVQTGDPSESPEQR